MDSDSDQDEDEVKPSFSVTISERGSHCRVLGRVCSDSMKASAEMCNNSGSVEETPMKGSAFLVKDSTSDISLVDSVNLSNSEDPSLTLVRVSCCRPQKRVSYKNVVDDRVLCAEKAMDDICDSIHNVKENEDDSREETPPSSQDNPEQTSDHNESVTNPENSAKPSPSAPVDDATNSTPVDGATNSTPVDGATNSSPVDGATNSSPIDSATNSAPVDNATISAPIDSATISAPVDSHTQNEQVDRQEERVLLNKNSPEKTSNDLLPHHSTTNPNKKSQRTNQREVQNKTLEISQSGSNQAIEMNAQSLVFQSTSVDPVENSLSTHSVGSSGLTQGVTHKESEQDSSSTGQLAGRKRKHSGKKTADAEGAVGGSSAENSVSSGDAEESFENKDSDKDAKKKKNRCAVCRKKVGLTGFECRCGGLFCAVHRYSDKHDCTFDYREMGAQEIRRNNPVVVGEKIQKI